MREIHLRYNIQIYISYQITHVYSISNFPLTLKELYKQINLRAHT
jgi:hypothetical protein